MATPSTLYEYYTSKGQALPSLTERAKIYESSGLGSAATYQGTAAQNTSLLGKLATPVAPVAPTAPVVTAQPKTTWDTMAASGQYGQVATPRTTEIPGVGTLTSVPKNPISAAGIPQSTPTPPAPSPTLDAGLYQRTGVTPPSTPSTYSGPSVVDYLASTGKPSDFNSRATLAAQNGIANYTGTAEQNTLLLSKLRGGTASPTATPVTAPAFTSSGAGSGFSVSNWGTTGSGAWTTKPVVKVGNATLQFDTPEQYIQALTQLQRDNQGDANIPALIEKFRAVIPEFTKKPATPVAPNTKEALMSGSGTTVPIYGKKETPPTNSAQDTITKAYEALSTQIDQIEKDLKSATLKSDEEKRLEADLVAKKAALAAFDTETLGRLEAYQGQGRGATERNVATRQDSERRTRALERLGLAQEAQTYADLLAIAQDDRKMLSQTAQNQLTLAGKKLDIALGLQGRLDKMDEQDKSDARQFLLDIVAFGEGKTYDQLDADTQQQINNAVANSPITLGMIKTALAKGAEGKSEYDELLSPGEAKSYNVPYGTTKGQIAGKSAPADSGGGYTAQEERKLRAAGVDSSDVEAADRYLYGDGVRTGVLTIPELDSITEGLWSMFTDLKDVDPEDRKADDPTWTTIEDVMAFINDYGIIDVNDEKIKLSDLQKNVITSSLEVKAQENQGFWSRVIGFGRP